jgi:hypothetical protein
MTIIGHILQLISFMQLPRSRKQIVFYSEGRASWEHLETLISDLLSSPDTPVCYITSGKDDPGLQIAHANYAAFLTDEGWVRNWLFENIDTDVMVMTMPDLDLYQVKRSHHPVHYIYAQHSLVSLHMAYRTGAFDHFDTILCSGPYHMREIKAMEEKYNLSKKKLIEHGYSRLFNIRDEGHKREGLDTDKTSPKHVLIAPSWGPQGLIETVGSIIVNNLLDSGYKVTLRPHPQTVKFSKNKIDNILKRNGSNPLFSLEVDVSGQNSLHESDVMISDWSGAALEYAFGLKKPVLYIDVPEKVNNPHYEELEIVPFEFWVRDKIGRVLPVQKLDQIDTVLSDIINSSQMSSDIEKVCRENLFDATVNNKPISHIRNIIQDKNKD